MKEIALVTYKQGPHLPDGEQLLFQELQRRGYPVTETAWDDGEVDWKRYGQVILRASWDYHTRLSEFNVWLERLKADGINIWNPVDVVRWSIDKHYLQDLEAKGIPIIPTIFLSKGENYDVATLVKSLRAEMVVIKPTVGASAHGVGRFGRDQIDLIRHRVEQLSADGDVMMQKFMPQVSTEGEYSLVFIDKQFSHAALKRPAKGDFRTQPHWGGSERAVQPSNDLIAQAKRVVDCVDSPLLYARVDGVDDNGTLRLMELELAEPYLFFELHPEAPNRFIEAMVKLAG